MPFKIPFLLGSAMPTAAVGGFILVYAAGRMITKLITDESSEQNEMHASYWKQNDDRYESSSEDDPASEDNLTSEENSSSEDNSSLEVELSIESLSVVNHLVDRLLRFVRMAGIIQRISENTPISRNEVVAPGASRHQDTHSSISGIQCGHVVRVGNIDDRLRNYSSLFRELRNFLGHTQMIPTYANEYHGVGGHIDRLQSELLNEINEIDFSEDMNLNAYLRILNLVTAFVDAVKKGLNRPKLTENQRRVLNEAIKRIEGISPHDLFKKGQDGYLHKHREYDL